MANPNYSPQGWVARALIKAASILDSNNSDSRGPRYNGYSEIGAQVGMLGEPALADEGSLIVATMNPSQSPIFLGVSAAFSATAAALVIHNNAPQNSGIRLNLREIHFLCGQAPQAGTGLLYATVIDPNPRNPSTVSTTPATQTAYRPLVSSLNFSNAPIGILPTVWFPNSVTGGAPPIVPGNSDSAVVVVGNGNLRSVIPVGAATSGVQDDYRIVFGATDKATGATLRSSAGAAQIIEPHPAVSLDPQAYFLLHMWAPSNTTNGLSFSGLDVSMILR